MPSVRTCRVTIVDSEGLSHSIQLRASSLFEAAAAAVAAFRQEAWAETALTPNARLRVEVQLPAIVHDVPLKAVERWVQAPSTSPREEIRKRPLRNPGGRDT